MFTKQRGETIVEVMLCVVLLGFTISSSFVIARRNLYTGQAASERVQVLAKIESQIERLKYMATLSTASSSDGVFGQDRAFCITKEMKISIDVNDQECDHGDFPANANLSISIIYDKDGPNGSANTFDDHTFNISAQWNRVGGGNQPEILKSVYRLHPGSGGLLAAFGVIPPPSPTPTPTPPPTPAVTCEPAGSLNMTSRARDTLGTDPYNAYVRAVDVVFGGGLRSYTKSFPDLTIPGGFKITKDDNCPYDASFVTWCTYVNTTPPTPPETCFGGNQPNEAARITLWSNSSVVGGYNQCRGTQIGYLDTTDPETGATTWGGTVPFNVLNSGTANCVELTHMCVFEEVRCNNIQSSVYIHSFNITAR